MSFACPRRHQSYASFRLEVFHSLFGPTYIRTRCKYSSNPRNQLRNGKKQHRCFGSSTKLSKQKGSRNVEQDAELRTFMKEQLVHKTAESQPSSSLQGDDNSILESDALTNAEVLKPPSPNGNESGIQDWNCPSCGLSNVRPRTTCAQCSAPASSPVASFRPEYREPSKKRRSTKEPRPWSPYSRSGQDDLKTLVQDLKKAASEAVVFEQEYHAAPAKGARVVNIEPHESPILHGKGVKHIELDSEREPWHGVRRLSLDLPESPVMRRLRKEKPHKRAPTDEELSALSNNPWASMLASPVRHCQGTGVRLPSALLIPWSFVRRRANDATYLVPHILGDMKKLVSTSYFEKVSEPSEHAHGSKGEDEMPQPKLIVQPRSLPPSNSDSKAEPLLRGGTELPGKTTILPYQPLIEQLTTRMIRRDNGATARGAVQRLLTHRIKASSKEALHYARDGEERSHMDLNSLQWQPDIPKRMTGIMRERVLTALESVGILNNTEKTIVPVPLKSLETGRMVVVFEPTKDEGADPLKYSFKAAEAMPEPSPRIPHQKLRQLIRDKFAGSFLLHINSSPLTVPDQPSAVLSEQVPNLLPQTISVNNTIRLPVFNLQQMMGFRNGMATKHIALRYRQVLRSSKVLSVPKLNSHPIYRHSEPSLGKGGQPLVQDSQDTENDPAYLLFISSHAPMAQELAKEVWQLWRYLGGTVQEKEPTPVTLSVLQALEESFEDMEEEAEDIEVPPEHFERTVGRDEIV